MLPVTQIWSNRFLLHVILETSLRLSGPQVKVQLDQVTSYILLSSKILYDSCSLNHPGMEIVNVNWYFQYLRHFTEKKLAPSLHYI